MRRWETFLPACSAYASCRLQAAGCRDPHLPFFPSVSWRENGLSLRWRVRAVPERGLGQHRHGVAAVGLREGSSSRRGTLRCTALRCAGIDRPACTHALDLRHARSLTHGTYAPKELQQVQQRWLCGVYLRAVQESRLQLQSCLLAAGRVRGGRVTPSTALHCSALEQQGPPISADAHQNASPAALWAASTHVCRTAHAQPP